MVRLVPFLDGLCEHSSQTFQRKLAKACLSKSHVMWRFSAFPHFELSALSGAGLVAFLRARRHPGNGALPQARSAWIGKHRVQPLARNPQVIRRIADRPALFPKASG